MMTVKYTLCVIVFLVLAGCGSSETTVQLSAEERFDLGMEKFRDEDYLEAIEDFKIVALQFSGSTLGDDAQFHLAECRYHREEFVLAAYEYEILLRTMPTSEFVSRARYQRGMCYYRLSPGYSLDQDYTRKAIDEFQAFVEYHPADTLAGDAESKIVELHHKLAKKEYENGLIYMRMEYYRASSYYFDIVLEKFHDTPYAEPALLKKAEALLARSRFDEALQEIVKFEAKYAESPRMEEARNLRRTILNQQESAKRPARPSPATAVPTPPGS